MVRNIWILLWCKYSHCGQFQATSVMLLCVEPGDAAQEHSITQRWGCAGAIDVNNLKNRDQWKNTVD